MKDKKSSRNGESNQLNSKAPSKRKAPVMPIMDLYTSMCCADELAEYDTIYSSPSNVVDED